MNATLLILVIACFGLLLALAWFPARKREADLRTVASRCGFTYMGAELPESLTLQGYPFEDAISIWNVIAGDRIGLKVVAFDCRFGGRKGGWSTTTIAVQTPNDVFRTPRFSPHLTVDRCGDWLIMYEPKGAVTYLGPISSGLMPVPELEGRLRSLSDEVQSSALSTERS